MGNLCACAARSDEDVDEIVDITHFEIGRVIGKGSFGKVCIVKHKKTGKEFALKYINKGMIASKNLAKHMIEERRILEEAKSSFICNLRYAFQDDIHILMVIDMSLGGDIAFHLKFGGAFSEERTKFYVAEISCGLAFLHSLKIVHRDLKPGNVLLSATGHASLTDFNLATHYQDGHLLTSRSGTLKYMAPEVVAHKGYLNAIDWWSLGVMTFEMLFGLVPFDNSTEKEIKRAILNEPVKMPADSAMTFKVSENSRAIIFGLLEREPSHRLGSKETGGVTAIQKHIWYNGWDWDKVEKQQLPVPFLPDVKRCTYYNRVLNLDDVMFDETPLQNRPVKKSKSSLRSSKGTSKATIRSVTESEIDHQLMKFEIEFLDYDYTKPPKIPVIKTNQSISSMVHASMASVDSKDKVKDERRVLRTTSYEGAQVEGDSQLKTQVTLESLRFRNH